jgi:hypothetical protein
MFARAGVGRLLPGWIGRVVPAADPWSSLPVRREKGEDMAEWHFRQIPPAGGRLEVGPRPCVTFLPFGGFVTLWPR